MKLKEEYILQKIADQWVVIDTNGRSVNFNRLLALNESGRFLWETLEAGAEREELISALTGHFGIDPARATADADAFIQKLKELGCMEDEE